ncbi:unnamed protein product [Phytophthora lilii]|uniref:Unnamed protein product n=1 Tax=Phytophthora lilii TaxID=2077276 RepID=A0A9W6TYS8_9STRA|nr:unnamed protein product [Phytophthora lilii]
MALTTPRSRGDGVRRPRPASAAVFASKRLVHGKAMNGMDSMVQAAHEHLMDASPRSCSPRTRRRRDNQEDGGQVSAPDPMRLSDHMDSFPLVPLPVIPQLDITDLEKVERGLHELLGSLMPHESDQQLGRYATRQLSLVQRHLTQQRAQERVFQMLRGDLPVAMAPIGVSTLRKSSSTSAVKIGSTPRSAATYSVASSANNQTSGSLPRVIRSQPDSNREAANLHWKSKKAGVEMARAKVQANAATKTSSVCTTGFVISAGDNASRKRRRPRAPKRSPEEEARYRAQLVDRERENRRQAAYQRILARQALQAKRKQEQMKQRKADHTDGIKDSKDNSVSKEKDEHDSDSDSESEASDVSNCSESDEANEKAILALEVKTESPQNEDDGSPRSDGSDSGDFVGNGGDGSCDIGSNDDDDRPEASECLSVRSDRSGSTEPEAGIQEHSDLLTDKQKAPSILSAASIESEDIEKESHKQKVDITKRIDEAHASEQEHVQEAAIKLDLQYFMASRAAAKLEQLQAEKEAREVEHAKPVFDLAPLFAVSCARSGIAIVNEKSPGSAGTEEVMSDVKRHEIQPATETLKTVEYGVGDRPGSNDNGPVEMKSNMSSDEKEKEASWIDEVRQSATSSRANSPESSRSCAKALSFPRSPVSDCKDYRFYFTNFQCILTSVFEQYRSRLSNTSSSSSLYHRPVGATGEHTMRLQQKLYESWQSIMHDYATVFGPKIVAPEGIVPAAAAKPWAPHYRINSTARKEVSEIVTQALQRLGGGWEEHPSGLGLKTTWNLLWTWSKPRVERQTLLAWQKVNHFQHAKALTRKDCLKKHIGKYLAAGGRLRQAFDIIPPTFLLPKEYVAFVQAFQERSERLRRDGFSEGKNIWIMKPVALSRGRGISLVNDLCQVIYGEQVVIQEYIAAPRLLDGFKFDLRLYVLVTSFNPLEAFLYDEGFVRLCTRPYEDGDLSNIFVHLTNSSIQKDNEEAIAGSTNPIASVMKEGATLNAAGHSAEKDGKDGAGQTDAGGTKTTLAYLWRRLAAEGVDVEQVKRNIEEVVLKALLCGEDQIPFQVNSFDLLGYDILLDADLRPWLIEINSSPSMARDHDLDYQVKDAMMLDTLRVVDPLHFDRAKLAEVIARRQRDLEDEKKRPHAHTCHPREAEMLATRQLNEDLTAILRGKVPRAYGEMPENLGNYRRLCPHTNIYNQLVKLKRSCLRVGDRKP